jgi:hypothetical protein
MLNLVDPPAMRISVRVACNAIGIPLEARGELQAELTGFPEIGRAPHCDRPSARLFLARVEFLATL